MPQADRKLFKTLLSHTSIVFLQFDMSVRKWCKSNALFNLYLHIFTQSLRKYFLHFTIKFIIKLNQQLLKCQLYSYQIIYDIIICVVFTQYQYFIF